MTKELIDEVTSRMARGLLTQNAEIESLRQDAERYRELRKGKALVIKCGNVTIFTGSNPDYERKYPEALDAAIDAVLHARTAPATNESTT